LADLKEKRERRNRLKWFASAAAIFMLLFGIIGAISYLYFRNLTHESTIAAQKSTIAIERDSLQRAYHSLEAMQSDIQQKEAELLLKQQELDKINQEFKLKDLALTQKESELAQIMDEIVKIEIEKNEIKARLNKYKEGETSGDLNITYSYDGVKYLRYGFFEQSDLDKWKSQNEEVCRRKIPQLLSDSLQVLQIPEEFMEAEPGLVYLILKSPSISEVQEKQGWFDMLSIMNDDQIFKLYDILARERYKLSVLWYRDDTSILNNEAYSYAYDGDFDAALSTIDKAIEKARVSYANKYDSKGEILLMKGDTQQAVEMWNEIMKIAPNFIDSNYGSTPFHEQLLERGLIKP
jgi:tetratricopeptide (TPR) repeat protein